MRTVHDLLSLSGKSALVVGGAGAIGRVVCAALGEVGAVVISADQGGTNCPEADSNLEVDLLDEVSTRRLVRAATDLAGGIDVLIHCAAYTGQSSEPGWAVPIEEQSLDAWDRAQRVNLSSAFVLLQEARATLQQRGRGSVVLMSSIYGSVAPSPTLYEGTSMHNPVGYGASKAGLLQITRHFASVYAPDIRVNAISPGGIWRQQDAGFVRRYSEGTPLGRMGTEEDLKGAIVYLASELSQYVTGHDLVVDGGRTII